MTKLDFKKSDRALYSGKSGTWTRLTVPPLRFLMIDGLGDPSGPVYARSIAALYPLAYGIKFICKSRETDYVVPPLEATWWADDMTAYTAGNRDEWRWTAMLRLPDFATPDDLESSRTKALAKLAKKPDALTDAQTLAQVRIETLDHGDCLQTLHIGPYAAEAPVLADLHDRVMPDMGLTFAGNHHEIYLSDPRRVAPEKLKTILRQPVKPL